MRRIRRWARAIWIWLDELRWSWQFARTSDEVWEKLAAQALADCAAGDCDDMDDWLDEGVDE
jgi:hypothetical protein